MILSKELKNSGYEICYECDDWHPIEAFEMVDSCLMCPKCYDKWSHGITQKEKRDESRINILSD